MAKFLKIIGSGRVPCPEPYVKPFVDFSDRRNPKGKINIGDELILYAAGGRQRIFAKVTVASDVYPSGNPGWPYRLDIDYDINLLPGNGVPINEVASHRDLSISVRRQSYLGITDAEFDSAVELLESAVENGAVSQLDRAQEKKYFTAYWKNKTWDANALWTPNGELIDYAGSNQFRERGVSPGDVIYIVTVKEGKLFVSGKIIVGFLGDAAEAEQALGTKDLWEAKDHVIASESTPMNWELQVPDNITEQLEFISPNGDLAKLVFSSPGFLDQQTLRGVRRLSPDWAEQIDGFLQPLKPIPSLWTEPRVTGDSAEADFESYADGKKQAKYVTYYERDRKNRAAAVRIHGYQCKACDLRMEDKYGPLGKDFIHVHHVKPVSQYEKPKEINPATDLTVLCPNCHAMVHKKKSKTLSVEELRSIIHSHQSQ